MTGLKAFLTGALLFAGAVTTQAVPTLDLTLTQDNWDLRLDIDRNHDGETLVSITDNGVWQPELNIFTFAFSASWFVYDPVLSYFPGWSFFTVGTHEIVFTYESGLTASDSYTIVQPVGPAPVPDGGATAGLLALGVLGTAVARRNFIAS